MNKVRTMFLFVFMFMVGVVSSAAQDIKFDGVHLEAKRTKPVKEFFQFNDFKVRDFQVNPSVKFKINDKYTLNFKYAQRLEKEYGGFSIAISRCVLFCK